MAKKKLGKILIIPKGDYDAAVLYRRLDLVKYNGTSYLCKKDNTIGIEPTNIERWYKVVDAVGDMDIFFEEVSKRENISSSDPLSLILGKIKKWFDDLKPVAFSGKYKDLVDTPQNATISVAGLMSEKDKKKLDDITESADSVSYSASLTNGTKVGTIRINGEDYELYAPTNTDTKNTAGAKDSTQKLYLIGATSQANAPQTYSQDTAYVGTDGCIYSNNKKTITIGEVSRSAAITVQGNYALDAIEKNASIEGTLAYLISSQNTVFANQLSQLNSNLVYKAGDIIGNRNTLMWLFGTITTDGREIYTFIPFNKPIVGTCNFNLIEFVIRHNNSYVFDSFNTDDIAVVKVDVINFANSGLHIKLYKEGGVNWYAAMNNDILSVAIKFTVTIS